MHKDYRKIVRELRKQGFTVDESGKNHSKVYSPEGEWVDNIASTPSEQRGIHNFLSKCKRAGFKWPAK